MRIAYLTQSYPPMVSGAAVSASQIAESMAKRGHQVLVIAASDRENAYHIYKRNLTVLRLRSFHNPLRVGQRMLVYPHLKVMKALNRFKPDVIHAHDPLQMGPIALKYGRQAGIPVTLTIHQLPWFVASYLPDALKPLIEKTIWMYARISLRRYTALITPTQTIVSIIEEYTGFKLNAISNGLDTEIFHPSLDLCTSTCSIPDPETATRIRLGLPLNVPIILHVGRLDADKSVDKIIRAAAPAIRESEAHLLIVGDGCHKMSLIQLCRKLGIEKQVHFSGFIHRNDLPDIYRMANVFVTASEIETQGIVLLEAAASGLPIVAVDATCISEIVHDRFNGFLVKTGDIHAFGEAIITLLNHPEDASQMGLNGRIIVGEHELQNTWMLHENLYREMAQQTSDQHITKTTERLPQLDFLKTLMGLK